MQQLRPNQQANLIEEEKEPPKVNNNNPFQMQVDEDKYEMDSMVCGYCKMPFTQEQQENNEVGLFLSEGCFHQFHKPCFKQYATKQMLTAKKLNNEVIFGEVKCLTCGMAVTEME